MSTTLINTFDELVSVVEFDFDFLDIEATGTVKQSARAVFDLEFLQITPNSDVLRPAEADFDLPFLDILAHGRVNDEANVFGAVDFDFPFLDIQATSGRRIKGVAVLDLEFLDIEAQEHSIEADTGQFILTLNVIAPQLAGNYRTHQGRVKINGNEVDFVTATYNEPETGAGATLAVRLANRADKDLLTSNATFEFAIGKKIDINTWDETSMDILVTVGKPVSSVFNMAWAKGGPADEVSFESMSQISAKFLKTPPTDLVIYDSLRQTVNASDFRILYDTQGRTYLTQLVAAPGMTLFDLFNQIFVLRCGFSSIVTDLDNFPVQRLNCRMGGSYIEAIKGYIGMYSPDIYVVGDVIHIEDSTNPFPTGFPEPLDLRLSDVITQSINQDLLLVDALRVLYNENSGDYDFYETRSEIIPERTNGIAFGAPGYLSTTGERFWRDYRKLSNPAVVLESKLARETTQTIDHTLAIVTETDETFDYDSAARLLSRTKILRQVVPTLSGVPTPSPTLILQDVTTEDELREYQSHPYKRGQVYQSFKSINVSGIIAYDPTTPQLGQPYKQGIIAAMESGNVTDQTIVTLGNILTRTEDSTPNQDGTISTRVMEYNHLTGLTPLNSSDNVPADIGVNSLNSGTNEILVFDADDRDRTDDVVDDFHCGELPVLKAVALARRELIRRKTKQRKFSAPLIGYDKNLKKGVVRRLVGRDSEILGRFKIKSRSVTCSKAGVVTNLTGRQV